MDVACPSLPPKILTPNLTDAKLRPDKHTPRMAAEAVGLAVCSLYVQLVNIESFSSRCAIPDVAHPSLYKTGDAILSSSFCATRARRFDNFAVFRVARQPSCCTVTDQTQMKTIDFAADFA